MFKDLPELTDSPLAPSQPLAMNAKWTAAQKALAAAYNRVGGLMTALAAATGVEVPAVLAVFFVESSGRAPAPGRAVIRFECNLFYTYWGAKNPAAYRRHFKQGGLDGAPGKPWENHEFRDDPAQPFRPVHKSQVSECAALATATRIAAENAALVSVSIGGCQIVIDNYKMIGYNSPKEMYAAFQAGERAHVLGFFDFCSQKPAPKKGNLIVYLKANRWKDFANYYNGPGNAETYGARIKTSYDLAKPLI